MKPGWRLGSWDCGLERPLELVRSGNMVAGINRRVGGCISTCIGFVVQRSIKWPVRNTDSNSQEYRADLPEWAPAPGSVAAEFPEPVPVSTNVCSPAAVSRSGEKLAAGPSCTDEMRPS